MDQQDNVPGFCKKLLALVRCVYDGTPLNLAPGFITPAGNEDAVLHGTVVCSACQTVFPIDRGLLNMLDESSIGEESRNEQRQRNHSQFTHDGLDTPDLQALHQMEMEPTFEALPVTPLQTMLEVGCGEGRYTTLLAGRVKLVAVDFSIGLLRVLQSRLPLGTGNIGLVLGDVTTFQAAPQAFDYVLSTLTSNLPSRKHRDALYRLAQTALVPHGRFVCSGHLQGIRQIFAGQEKSAPYAPGGIYRYNFSLSEAADEVRPFFREVHARPMQIFFPLSRTLHLPTVRMSRLLERVPVLNLLGDLVLVTAEKPAQRT